MKRAKMIVPLVAVTTLWGLSPALGFDALYAKTKAGVIEVKTLPERTALQADEAGVSYFDRDNRLFSQLFSYIKKNDVAMTVPVEAEIEDAAMRFFAGSDASGRDLPDTRSVKVEVISEQEVLSIGIRGGYTEDRFEQGKQKLEAWLSEHPEFEATGPAYAVYWNGPYVPGPLKRSEVHIPVTGVGTELARTGR